MITIMLGCRAEGNSNSNLHDFLLALAANAESKDNYEVLIKFDEDDTYLESLYQIIVKFANCINIKTIVTPRGQGYSDLHKAYLDLLLISNSNSKLYWVLSDDAMVIGYCWDRKLLQVAEEHENQTFVITPCNKPFYSDMSSEEALNIMDNYPVWSAAWIATCGGFGYTFSTDGWTNLLCWDIYHKTGVDCRKEVKDLITPIGAIRGIQIIRNQHENDMPGSERWSTTRKSMIEKVLSRQGRRLLSYSSEALMRRMGL